MYPLIQQALGNYMHHGIICIRELYYLWDYVHVHALAHAYAPHPVRALHVVPEYHILAQSYHRAGIDLYQWAIVLYII
jgi:hypothetical protein